MVIRYTLILFGLFLISVPSCDRPVRKEYIDLATFDSEDTYHRGWLTHQDEDGNPLLLFEYYTSVKKDTVWGKRFFYQDAKIDTVNSMFYELDWTWDKDSLVKGRIKFYDRPDGDGPVSNQSFSLLLLRAWRDTIETISFSEEGKNWLEFEFKSNTDAIVGGLRYSKATNNGRVVAGEIELDYLQISMPVANKKRAYNPFNRIIDE
ncbi:hypothetical protein [Robertkochia aurantiaca]|uniref:hypothetical protein n=1 Tax=Robertkochia aurantiaca TaxID=2873700 RepID=UPI001CCF912E|nr:hypothetical protein [Robertkochia sp. 3YJGBD-33]